jgi:sugar/nucleoside kinase (ribokinase family)
MVDYFTFGVIIDDIVDPGGSTRMGVLGGGGPQTAFGMRIWSDSVGLIAGIGQESKSVVLDWLDQCGIEHSGIRITGHLTPRAWQLMEADGHRTQVWRVAGDVINAQLARSIHLLPESYKTAKACHFGMHPDEFDGSFTRALLDQGIIVSVEPFKSAERVPELGKLALMLRGVHIFSANQDEAVSLVAEVDPILQAQRFLEIGVRVFVLRMGAKGSRIFSINNLQGIHIPAVPVEVVDPVGAGNAYCGGFLAGWVETQDLYTAGVYGSVASSFLVERFGVPVVNDEVRHLAWSRVKLLENLNNQVNRGVKK